MVHAYSDTSPMRGGFMREHIAMTGINVLFEGITVAELDEKSVKTAGCKVCSKVLLRNSRGLPMVVVREADSRGGQVIIDGAFTKLYCKVDAAGSKRFRINCA